MNSTSRLLRIGNKGPAVRELQLLLNTKNTTSPKLNDDSHFGNKTKIAVESFQKFNNLVVDGIVGKKTWHKLRDDKDIFNIYRYPAKAQKLLTEIAIQYIGATESKSNKMGKDSRMKEIFESDNYAPNGNTDGYPWCCSFVSMCVQKLIDSSNNYKHIKKPFTPSVSNFKTIWAVNQNCRIFTPEDKNLSPDTGDIVIFTFSHIGIVEKENKDGSIITIEGNTNSRGSREGVDVRRKTRNKSIIKCFIRLPVKNNYNFEEDYCIIKNLVDFRFSEIKLYQKKSFNII